MALPSLSVKIFFPRNLFHTKIYVRTYLSAKYSSCLLNKCSDQKLSLGKFSRSFSSQSLFNYPTMLFNYVAESNVCAHTKDFFVYMHDLTGLPWWCIIAASAGIMKIYSLPWTVYQQKLIKRLQAVNDETSNISKRVFQEMKFRQQHLIWTPRKAHKMFKLKVMSERKALIEKNNCHPLKVILLGYLEVPVWIVTSMTWRTMAYGFSDDITSSKVLISQMINEGLFWCVNLTTPDPTYVLSLLILFNYLTVIELSQAQAKLLKKNFNTLQKVVTVIARCFGFLIAFICSLLPSSVAVFWLFSIMLTLLRDLLFISPKVRRALGLPYQNFSYKEVFETIKYKYLRKAK